MSITRVVEDGVAVVTLDDGKVNALDVPPSFYEDTDRWHVTLGDSDQDR